MTALTGLQCHLCQAIYPAEALYVCEKCLGPLEPVYDYGAIKVTREDIERRPKNLWRYRELLPIAGERLGLFWVGQPQIAGFLICSIIVLAIGPAGRAIVLA